MSPFDQIIDRKDSYSLKWDKYQGKDILPMWVADMDFRCAEPILDALKQRAEQGIFGYTKPEQYQPANQAVINWLAKQHNWHIESDWIVWVPGVVPAFNLACKAFCNPGEQVIVQTPNYPPLLAAPKLNACERVLVTSQLVDGRYSIDFEQLEKAAAAPEAKLLILCNPMNPLGTVLRQNELDRIAQICEKYDLVYCSDEIHCDLLVEPGLHHLPAGKHVMLEQRSITLMAASKTFNVAGLGTAFAIIPDAKIRRRFVQSGAGIMPWVTVTGLVATEAAFTHGQDWHRQLLEYLRQNRDYLFEQINLLPGLSMQKPDATFLAWIDASGLGIADPQAYAEGKGLGPSPGRDFGAPDFIRINYGCPKSYLQEAIKRLKA